MTADVSRSVRAETLKLLSLPATRLTVLGTLVATVVLAIAFGRQGGVSVLDVGLAPVGHSQAGFIVLGIVAAASEYGGGQISTTLTAMPRRTTLQAAKLFCLAVFTIPVAAVTVLAGIAVSAVVLGDRGIQPGFADAAGFFTGAVGCLTLTTLLSASVAVVVRRTVPAVACVLSYYFIVGPLLRGRADFTAYLPDAAGHSMWFPGGAERIGALTAASVVIAWVVLAAVLSTAVFHRRDA